jgi:hypothetical protein
MVSLLPSEPRKKGYTPLRKKLRFISYPPRPLDTLDAMNADSSHAPDLFLTTRWSLVLKARSDHASEALRALDDLCSAYWYPVYAFIRRTCTSPEDAEDLTQTYFAALLERGYLDRASQDKGKLRAFLLADVKLFLSNERGRQRPRVSPRRICPERPAICV